MRPQRAAFVCLSACVTALLGLVCAHAQQTIKGQVPLPPPRPSSLSPGGAAPVLKQPEAVAPAAITSAEPEAPEPSREQLRACSLEWRNMKKSGAAVGLIWRDFSKSCLGRN